MPTAQMTIPTKPRLPRYRRVSKKPLPHTPSKRDQDILAALSTYHFLTAEQLTRLLFPSLHSLSYCRERLKKLFHARLVDRLYLARSPYGSPLTVYSLSQKYQPAHRSPWFLEHHLHTVNFVISLRAYCQTRPDLELGKIVLERELRTNPVKVKAGSVIPDCYVQVYLRKDGRQLVMPLAVEIDRGTQPGKAWRRKIQRYLACVKQSAQVQWGSQYLTVVVVTTGGAERRVNLVRIGERELEQQGQTSQADLFRIASADLDQETPQGLCQGQRWYIPFQTKPVALLPEEPRA